MALRMNAEMRRRLVPEPDALERESKPAAAPENIGREVLEEVRARSAAADQRLVAVLDEASRRLLAQPQPAGKPISYRMTHTFKRDEHGRIVSAETIVQPMEG